MVPVLGRVGIGWQGLHASGGWRMVDGGGGSGIRAGVSDGTGDGYDGSGGCARKDRVLVHSRPSRSAISRPSSSASSSERPPFLRFSTSSSYREPPAWGLASVVPM